MLTRWSAEALDRELARLNPVPGRDLGEAAHSPAATALLRHIFDLADGWDSERAGAPIVDAAPEHAVPEQTAPEPAAHGRHRWAGHGGSRPVRGMATALALVALVAGGAVTVVATVGHPTVPHRSTTRWLAARPLVAGSATMAGNRAATGPNAASSWKLVGDLVPAGWKLGTPGPGPGMVTCPTTAVCYVTGDTATSASGPSVLGGLYVSTNGASTWSVLALPPAVTLSSELTCVSALVCAAGGLEGGTTVFVETRDGGHRWTVTTTGAGGGLVQLSCVSAARCMALSVTASAVGPLIGGAAAPMPLQEQFVRTSNGGSSWTATALPATVLFSSLQCTSVTRCIAIGAPVDTRLAPPHGIALWTGDGGARWQRASLPAGVGFDELSSLSCSGSEDCMAVGAVTVANPSPCSSAAQSLQTASGTDPAAASCSTGATVVVSTMIATADGGRTWQVKPVPSTVPEPQLDDVACATPSVCWAAGTEAVARGETLGSSVLLGTADAGGTWTVDTVAVPANARNDQGGDAYMAVGSISCPSATVCVGLGVVDQGAEFAPVYRMEAAP